VLRRISVPKRDEAAGGWRRLHNEELHNLYASLHKITVIKWAEHVARMEEIINTYNILVGNPAGNRALGITRRR